MASRVEAEKKRDESLIEVTAAVSQTLSVKLSFSSATCKYLTTIQQVSNVSAYNFWGFVQVHRCVSVCGFGKQFENKAFCPTSLESRWINHTSGNSENYSEIHLTFFDVFLIKVFL